MLPGYPGDFPHRLDSAYLSVSVHNGDEHRIFTDSFAHLFRVDDPVLINRYFSKLEAQLFQRFR